MASLVLASGYPPEAGSCAGRAKRPTRPPARTADLVFSSRRSAGHRRGEQPEVGGGARSRRCARHRRAVHCRRPAPPGQRQGRQRPAGDRGVLAGGHQGRLQRGDSHHPGVAGLRRDRVGGGQVHRPGAGRQGARYGRLRGDLEARGRPVEAASRHLDHQLASAGAIAAGNQEGLEDPLASSTPDPGPGCATFCSSAPATSFAA